MPLSFLAKSAGSPSKTFRVCGLAFLLGLAFARYPVALAVGIGVCAAAVLRLPSARRVLVIAAIVFVVGALRPRGPTIALPTESFAGLRAASVRAVRRAAPGPEGTLLLGMSVGDTTGMPRWLTLRFRRTGTSHLLAVSGANVTIAAGTLVSLLFALRLRRRAVAIGAAGAVCAFALFAGAEPPVVRAAFMALLVLAARELGRKPDSANLLIAAACIMLALDPAALTSVSFALSFTATGGLLWLTPPIAARLETMHFIRRAPEFLRGTAADGLAAQLATLPVALGTFGTFSAVSPLANILAAPFVPLLTIGGGALLAAAGILPDLGRAVGLALAVPVRFLLVLLAWCDAVPGAFLAGGAMPLPLAVSWYVFLAILIVRARDLSDDGKARMLLATNSS
ncbi:ComEC/Rec2 family competence protein [Patescibacteria group bacterium]|nr:MAG: ComEC/Rec2 family competence protein [Patescibacteria group bacterium]